VSEWFLYPRKNTGNLIGLETLIYKSAGQGLTTTSQERPWSSAENTENGCQLSLQ